MVQPRLHYRSATEAKIPWLFPPFAPPPPPNKGCSGSRPLCFVFGPFLACSLQPATVATYSARASPANGLSPPLASLVLPPDAPPAANRRKPTTYRRPSPRRCCYATSGGTPLFAASRPKTPASSDRFELLASAQPVLLASSFALRLHRFVFYSLLYTTLYAYSELGRQTPLHKKAAVAIMAVTKKARQRISYGTLPCSCVRHRPLFCCCCCSRAATQAGQAI